MNRAHPELLFIFSSLSACRVLPWVLPWRSRKFQPPSQATLLSESGDWGKKENFKLCESHQPPLPRQVRRPPSYKVSLRQPPLIVGCNVFKIPGVETIFEDLIYQIHQEHDSKSETPKPQFDTLAIATQFDELIVLVKAPVHLGVQKNFLVDFCNFLWTIAAKRWLNAPQYQYQ